MCKEILEKIATKDQNMFIKHVPGETASGVLDPKAYAEINQPAPTDEAPEPVGLPPVEAIRASMGWPAATDISRNELQIENHVFAGIPVRTYVQTALADETLPTIVFYHGGGFFGGDLDNVDLPCRRLADLDAVRVISVDYGLAPEAPYPNAPLDAYRTLVYIHQNHDTLKVDPSDISIMGDSAGGNLTYVVSLLDRNFGTNYVKNAISLYPVVYQGHDAEKTAIYNDPSLLNAKEHEALIHGYVRAFIGSFSLIDIWYVKSANPESWMISPINASEAQLAELPRTLFICGEYDALRMQGEAFYNKAKAAGADITYLRYDGMVHAFMDKVGDYVQADDCLKETIAFIMSA